jgi:putative thioredoxin
LATFGLLEVIMAAGQHTIDVNEATFEEKVLAESKKRPVVVDFWAPWCGPCRSLGPVLEKLADEGAGAWVLAKLNTDENQGISQAFQIRGIPAVKAFVDGKVVDEFTGALPEPAVRKWLEGLVPMGGAEEAKMALAALQVGDLQGAAKLAEEALRADPDQGLALLVQAQLALQARDFEKAQALVRRVKHDAALDPLLDRIKAQLSLVDLVANAGDEPELRQRVEASGGNDADALLGVAAYEALGGDFDQAFDRALSVIRKHRASHGEEARIFAVNLLNLLPDAEARPKRTQLGMALH